MRLYILEQFFHPEVESTAPPLEHGRLVTHGQPKDCGRCNSMRFLKLHVRKIQSSFHLVSCNTYVYWSLEPPFSEFH